MNKRNWLLFVIGLFFGLVVLVMLFFAIGWVRLNIINGKVFVRGQPLFYTVLDERYMIRSVKENITGVYDSPGIDPELANYVFSGVVSGHKVNDEFILIGQKAKIRLKYSNESEISFFSDKMSSPLISKDRLVLTRGLVNGRMILVLFNDDFFVKRFVFPDVGF